MDGYQQQGFELLTTMLQAAAVSPGRQVWNLFLPDVTTPTPASLAFLATLLCSCRIPENFKPSILGEWKAGFMFVCLKILSTFQRVSINV
jgi:hypothetical protein